MKINSNSIFKPYHPISAAKEVFVEHDSYVELTQLARHFACEIAQAEKLGTMSVDEAAALNQAANNAKTLIPEHKQLIEERLRE